MKIKKRNRAEKRKERREQKREDQIGALEERRVQAQNADRHIKFRKEIDEANSPTVIGEIINKWWKVAFPKKSFPEKGGGRELVTAVQYGLALAEMGERGQKPTERFMQNYEAALAFDIDGFKDPTLHRALQRSSLAEITIHKPVKGDHVMAKKATTKKAEDKEIGVATNRKDFAAKLLLQRKFPDSEIVERMRDKFPKQDEFKVARLSTLRRELNNGTRKGFDKLKTPLEAIRKGGKAPAKKASKGKKKAKKKIKLKKH